MHRQFRERITQHFGPLMDALIEKAKGVMHLMARDASGQWMQVTDPAIMAKCLNSGETFYRLSARDPDTKALADVFNRVMGMPTQELEIDVRTAPVDMSDDELIAAAAAILKQVEAHGAGVH